MTRMNWGENTGSFKIYEDALYLLEVQKWEYTNAKSGARQVKWTSYILNEAGNAMPGDTFVDFMVVGESSLWRIGQFVAGCGVDTSKLEEMETESQAFNRVLDLCVRRRVYATIRKTEYNGKPKNEVELYAMVDDQPTIDASEHMDADVPPHLRQQNADDAIVDDEEVSVE